MMAVDSGLFYDSYEVRTLKETSKTQILWTKLPRSWSNAHLLSLSLSLCVYAREWFVRLLCTVSLISSYELWTWFFMTFSKTLINKAHKHDDSRCFIVVIIIILNAIKRKRWNQKSFSWRNWISGYHIRFGILFLFYREFHSRFCSPFRWNRLKVHKYCVYIYNLYRYFYDNIIFM